MAQEVETRRLNDGFDIEWEQLISIVDKYRERTFDEEIVMIRQEFEGSQGVATKLRTSIKEGLKGDDFEDRDEEFGNNK